MHLVLSIVEMSHSNKSILTLVSYSQNVYECSLLISRRLSLEGTQSSCSFESNEISPPTHTCRSSNSALKNLEVRNVAEDLIRKIANHFHTSTFKQVLDVWSFPFDRVQTRLMRTHNPHVLSNVMQISYPTHTCRSWNLANRDELLSCFCIN